MPWTAEQVNVSDLHGNAVFYLINPLQVEKPLFAQPHYIGCIENDLDAKPDDIAWITYVSEADRRSYITWRNRRAKPHKVTNVHPGDTVWILYSSEADRQSYFRKRDMPNVTRKLFRIARNEGGWYVYPFTCPPPVGHPPSGDETSRAHALNHCRVMNCAVTRWCRTNALTRAYKEMIEEQKGLISALNEEIEILHRQIEATHQKGEEKMYYNLESSQADRVYFDEMVERYADAMIGALSEIEVQAIDVDEYVKIAWDNFDTDVVDDIEEAKARFFSAFHNKTADLIFEAYGAEFSFFRDLPAPREPGRGGWVWCLSGEKDGLLWKTDNYETENRAEAKSAALYYLKVQKEQ